MAQLIVNRGFAKELVLNDSISGLAVFTNTVPPAFATEKVHKLSSIYDAENLGIVGDYSDETPPTPAQVDFSGTVNLGDEVKLLINGAELVSVVADASITDVNTLVAALADKINNSSYLHGFKAEANSNILTVNPRKGLGGITVNLTVTAPANITATVTDFAGGTVSPTKLIHYAISRYFEYSQNPLYLGIFQYGQFTDELIQMQNYAKGEIAQFAVLVLPEQFSASIVNVFQAQAETLHLQKTPVVCTVTGDLQNVTVDTLPNLQELEANYINVFLGNNGNFFLNPWTSGKTYKYGDTVTFLNSVYQAKYDTTGSPLGGDWINLMDNPYAGLGGSYYGDVGALLGVLSSAEVHENIGWVGKFNLATDLFNKAAVLKQQYEFMSEADRDKLESKNYTFFRFYAGETGVFISDSWTAISRLNDYATLENNRVFNKAVRILTAKLNPFLNSPVYTTPDGKIRKETLAVITSDVEQGVEAMRTAGNISNYKLFIDENQNVLETGKLEVNLKLQPVGVARLIEATITFVLTI